MRTKDRIESRGNAGNSAVLCTLPFGSLNRRICGSLRSQTSHIPKTLYDIALREGKR